ncbi:hypothetical protein IMZ48_00770 [Candidatus Bathyarchaeota archaeon]|nr:hypothetical protein [Candidatus Bathyarchaeota archaeon]
MSTLTAKWTKLTSSPRLQRSSHTLSVVGSTAFVFGGELLPRQPVDAQLDAVDLSSKDGEKPPQEKRTQGRD